MAIKQLPPLEFLETAIEALKKSREQQDKWQKTFNEMFDGHFVPIYTNSIEEAIIKMVEIAFNDKPDRYGSNFSWWIYEADFGKNENIADSMKYKNRKIPMRTVKDLYNFYNMINESENL